MTYTSKTNVPSVCDASFARRTSPPRSWSPLRLGTVSARLDPERDHGKEPGFAIRTKDGVTRATGTYFAVTEYNGQSYAAVKKGEVKKKTSPPDQPDFSAYLKKKPKEDLGKSSKTNP